MRAIKIKIMNKIEILDAIEQRKLSMTALVDTAEQEGRKLSEDEQATFDAKAQEISDLKKELRKVENKELKEQNKMEERSFSLLEAINDVVNGKKHEENIQNYLDETRAMSNKAGLAMNGQIQIATRALNGIITTDNNDATHNGGGETIATETWDLLTALRDKSAIVKAGAQVFGNLVGDVEIPIMGAETVSFAGETELVSGSPSTFKSVSLKPQRVTCTVPVSKTWLRQNSPAVEAKLKQSIIDAINEKVEREILGDSNSHFDGLMYSANTVAASALTYADIVGLETDVEGNNMSTVFICDAKAKGVLKQLGRQSGGTLAIWNEGEIDDTPTYATNAVKSTDGVNGNIVCVDASQIVIGYWGDTIDLVIDPYTDAQRNIVNIVVTTYVDSAVVRDNAYSSIALS